MSIVGAILLMKSELDRARDLAHTHPIHLPAQENGHYCCGLEPLPHQCRSKFTLVLRHRVRTKPSAADRLLPHCASGSLPSPLHCLHRVSAECHVGGHHRALVGLLPIDRTWRSQAEMRRPPPPEVCAGGVPYLAHARSDRCTLSAEAQNSCKSTNEQTQRDSKNPTEIKKERT